MAAGAMALLPQAMWAQNPMPAIIQAQNSEARIDRLAHRKPTSFNAPRAAGPLVSVAAERYVFGRVDLAAGEYPQGVAVGVFKTGGLPGIAVANGFSNTVTILLANPDGTYQTGVDYATGVDPQYIAVADFNGDHKLDLAVVNWGGTVSILLGNGDGTFQPHVDVAAGAGVVPDVIAADFNGDNKPDLAVTSDIAGTVTILLGNGDGTFQPPVTYSVGPNPYFLVAGDFRGDNRQDLAVVGGSNDLWILLGNGDGTFQPAV
jgi:hypothetical protein